MKKLILLFFTTSFLLFLNSCNNNSEEIEPTNYIVLIIGQSNTHSGIGFDSELDKPVETIKQLGRFGNDNMQIVPAIEPLHHHTATENKIGFGLTFSKLLKDYLNTEKNIILVPCGYGGTGFKQNNWNKGDDLYSDAVYRVKYVLENYPDSEFSTILWHQGESDVGSLSYEKDLLGSLGTITSNKNFYKDEECILVANADNLTNINLTKFIKCHFSHNFDATITLMEISA